MHHCTYRVPYPSRIIGEESVSEVPLRETPKEKVQAQIPALRLQLVTQEVPETSVDLQTNLFIDHGLLKRIFLVLNALLKRGEVGKKRDKKKARIPLLPLIHRAIKIFPDYIHPVHEEAEEKYIFAPCIQSGFQPKLIDQLWQQHDIVKAITSELLTSTSQLMTTSRRAKSDQWTRICELVRFLIQIYEYHEAIEDTVVYPYFYQVAPRDSLQRKLWNDWLEKETKPLFDRSLREVEAIETSLGINLWTITPSASQLADLGAKVHAKSHLKPTAVR